MLHNELIENKTLFQVSFSSSKACSLDRHLTTTEFIHEIAEVFIYGSLTFQKPRPYSPSICHLVTTAHLRKCSCAWTQQIPDTKRLCVHWNIARPRSLRGICSSNKCENCIYVHGKDRKVQTLMMMVNIHIGWSSSRWLLSHLGLCIHLDPNCERQQKCNQANISNSNQEWK
jgi:hypothetical protein